MRITQQYLGRKVHAQHKTAPTPASVRATPGGHCSGEIIQVCKCTKKCGGGSGSRPPVKPRAHPMLEVEQSRPPNPVSLRGRAI
jgi:hypothetical protein